MGSIFEKDYRFTAQTPLDPDNLNKRFRSLDARLRQLESGQASLDDILGGLRLEGTTRLTNALQALVPQILGDAQGGYLNGLAENAIAWAAVSKVGATPGSIGAEVAGTMATHLSTPGVHPLSAIAGLEDALANKQGASPNLTAIAAMTPGQNVLAVGTGTTFQGLQLEAGDSIGISTVNGKLRIDALGSAAGEANSGANLGGGAGVYSGKTGTTLNFRSLVPKNNQISLATVGDTVQVGINPNNLVITIPQVTNLTQELANKQPLSTNLSQVAGFSPGSGKVVMGNGSALVMGDLIAGANISITPGPNGITIAAAASGEANTMSNLGTTGARLFVAKSGVNFQIRRVQSLASFLTVAEATNTLNLDFSVSGLLNAITTGQITWSKVSKSGASAADVGAEPSGTVASHASGSNVHPISGVNGLQTALNDRLTRVVASTQEINTSLAIAPTTANIGSYTPNVAGQNYWVLTQTSNSTINNPSGLTSGRVQFLDFTIIQDSTGGRSLAWGNNFVWGDVGPPTHKTTANAVNIYSFKAWGGKLYYLGHRSY
jgi:hypothetical protein